VLTEEVTHPQLGACISPPSPLEWILASWNLKIFRHCQLITAGSVLPSCVLPSCVPPSSVLSSCVPPPRNGSSVLDSQAARRRWEVRPVQCCAVQCSAVQCSAVQCSAKHVLCSVHPSRLVFMKSQIQGRPTPISYHSALANSLHSMHLSTSHCSDRTLSLVTATAQKTLQCAGWAQN
jgi:hypothetical protein